MTQTEEISHDVRRFAAERGVACASGPDYRAANTAKAAPATKRNLVSRLMALLYGLACYVVFFHTLLYAIGFVSGLVVPKTIDTGTVAPMAEALIVNLLVMSVFAIQPARWHASSSSNGGRSSCRDRSSAALTCRLRAWR